MSEPDAIAEAFLARWRGPLKASDRMAVVAELNSALQRALVAWPTLGVDPRQFGRWIAERTPTDRPPADAVSRLHAEALYLTCACAQNLPEALEAFDEAYVRRVPEWVAGLRIGAELIDELKQALREKLFLAGASGPPKIVQYSGEGSLESWLRMAALRTALNLLEARRPRPVNDEHHVAVGAAEYEPELDFIKERYRDDFSRAFREAFDALPQRARALLRFQHLEALTPERIGSIYDVHRTTAARWLAQAHQQVLDGTRERLIERLRVTPAECESLLGLLQSRLHLTLSSLFRTPAGE